MKKGMMKNKNKTMLITLGIVAVAIAVIAVIGNLGGKKESLPVVETVSAFQGDVTQEIDATGTVESEQKKTFFSPVNAKIQTMALEAGDSVEAGQDIIAFNLETLEQDNQKAELNAKSGRLDLQDAQQQAGEAAAKQAEAQAKIPELENQIAEKQGQADSLRQQISDAQSGAQSEAQNQIAQAQQQAEEAYNQKLAEVEKEYQDKKKEYEEETLPAYNQKLEDLKKLANAEGAEATAQAEYEHALQNPPAEPVKEEVRKEDYTADTSGITASADTLELQSQLESVSSEIAQLESELASKKAAAEADVGGLTSAAQEKMRISNNLAELEVKNIQQLLEEGRKGIQAEFKGVISEAAVTQGSTVTQGMELFTLQSTEQVCVDAKISKYDFDKVKEGQKASVSLGDKKYKGTVQKVSKIAIANEKGTPLIGVTVHIDNPDDGIFIGVEAKVSIQAAEAKNTLLLPVEAVNIGKNGSFCYVAEDGKIVRKDVETGVTSDACVEIKKGLKKGDQVLTDIGDHEEGDAVKAKETQNSEADK